ncbi:MAG: glutamate synthase large subunit [Myxococcota bacterium]|jgi:glutamate synthase domain-containing protein 2/glutamate synthase domain-containing protein 1/glutamate synthase domain-containing protein 3|nr:glutamate synthase large subunit [Myxococcota bacterium]
MTHFGLPPKEGLYDPALEHDACGIGFVADLRRPASHDIVSMGTDILCRLTHRGAAGADERTGDGAGLLLQTPHSFLRRVADECGFGLPADGAYASALVFLSTDAAERAWQKEILAGVVTAEGQSLIGWREVPIDPDKIGETARLGMPAIEQVFIGAAEGLDSDSFDRKLYVIRRLCEKTMIERGALFHVPSLSSKTLLYKGMFLAHQTPEFFPDLAAPDLESRFALVHQRYSTNTFPTWELAQPFRYLAHNGEINTLAGNANWMHAREGTLASDLMGEDLQKVFPVMTAGASDSAQFDNALEFLHMTGRDLCHAMMMMIPEAWENQDDMDPERRAFYEYHSCMMEPWDGPASITFSDGRGIGAVLDRNGLRPSRYVLTKDGRLVMGSEVGTLPLKPEEIEHKGRLEPGRTFYADLDEGRIIEDAELKDRYVSRAPYRAWVETHRLTLEALGRAAADESPREEPTTLLQRQNAFGYTSEGLKMLLAPMFSNGKEALGSMGDDAALACLSDHARPLFHYFKQHFAQVTNPAIDSIRERPVMTLHSTVGGEKNLLEETPEHADLLRLYHPVLSNAELDSIAQSDSPSLKSVTLPMLYKVADGGDGLRGALKSLCEAAHRAVSEGATVVILSDRDISPELAPIPSLLATGAVHHYLIQAESRTRCGLIVQTGDASEVAHFGLLIGYGAAGINPYVAFETGTDLLESGSYIPEDLSAEQAFENYKKAIDLGLLKIFAKMGISTLQSYRGAQIYEAVGLNQEVIDLAFAGTPSRISGIGFDVIAQEAAIRHARGFPGEEYEYPELDPGGHYQWRLRGEQHAFNPDTVETLQRATAQDSFATFQEFSAAANGDARSMRTLRGLLDFDFSQREPVALEDVEPATEIVRRFCTGAMSYGSISAEAHETLAIAMNRLGGRSNTGEGGEDPARWTPDANGDSRNSAIKQIASGRFGVTSAYLANAREMQIKIAQGAKPGEGGELPGHKVDETIAATRYSTPGVGLTSPPPHHDIYSIEDLAQLIHDLKNANRYGNVSVKLVSETGVGTIAAGVSKGKSDLVLISGNDGGTGASAQTSIKYAGCPWEIGLAETQQTLVMNDLRGRIRVQVDGGLKTGRDVVIGALLGADEYGFSTAPLVTMGCLLMRVCHLNTCPVGIATQRKELRERFEGTPENVVRYFMFVAEEVRQLMAELGYKTMNEMIGQSQRFVMREGVQHWKARHVDLSDLFHRPQGEADVYHTGSQNHGLEDALDHRLLELAAPALENGEKVEIDLPIENINRTVGTILGCEVSRKYGLEGLPDGTINIRFSGSAGQSLAAWLPKGITISVDGDANDYVGKGLSGGRVIVRAPKDSSFDPAKNIIAGNVILYGATGGEAFLNGIVGERFCVRNSGAEAVVEGVGEHGCEYMTGGRAIVLGSTGRNFGAGMSGGIAYVLDEAGDFPEKINNEMLDLDPLNEEDVEYIQQMLRKHFQLTRSQRADDILRKWEKMAPKFVKVFPREYKQALADMAGGAEADHG